MLGSPGSLMFGERLMFDSSKFLEDVHCNPWPYGECDFLPEQLWEGETSGMNCRAKGVPTSTEFFLSRLRPSVGYQHFSKI